MCKLVLLSFSMLVCQGCSQEVEKEFPTHVGAYEILVCPTHLIVRLSDHLYIYNIYTWRFYTVELKVN